MLIKCYIQNRTGSYIIIHTVIVMHDLFMKTVPEKSKMLASTSFHRYELFQTGLSCKPLSWLKFAECCGFGQHNDVVWPNRFVNWL